MNKEVQEYVERYPDEIEALYLKIRTLVIESVCGEIEEKLWAKLLC